MNYLNEEESSALKRNADALQRVILNVCAHDKILEAQTSHKGIDFIQLAYRALFNDFMANAINVFDKTKGARSFWWLYNQKKNDIDAFVKQKNINWEALTGASNQLKTLRNGTHFHFSHQYIFDYKDVWKEVGLKGDVLLLVIHDAWDILSHLNEKQYSKPLSLPNYNGEDAKEAAKFIARFAGSSLSGR